MNNELGIEKGHRRKRVRYNLRYYTSLPGGTNGNNKHLSEDTRTQGKIKKMTTH
jgi:hypothetical protein